ncbi:MAG TPA: hypothetical protein VMA77_11245 [Solirubrobacteraceae bacterium]|nr:hypothetical protein [Solirubrobacteraceae bacterium]
MPRHVLSFAPSPKLTLALLAAIVLAAGVPAAAAGMQTQTSIYSPFAASGQPAAHVVSTVRGHCWTGSLAVNHQDAWRCLSGNFIYDPCFSSAAAAGIVLCPASGPWGSSAIEIKLTQRLPSKFGNKGGPSTSGVPWALVTLAGWKCKLATGATTVIDGERQNYFCTGTKDALWGAPSRASEPWRIYAAPNGATKLSRRVEIKSAWF